MYYNIKLRKNSILETFESISTLKPSPPFNDKLADNKNMTIDGNFIPKNETIKIIQSEFLPVFDIQSSELNDHLNKDGQPSKYTHHKGTPFTVISYNDEYHVVSSFSLLNFTKVIDYVPIYKWVGKYKDKSGFFKKRTPFPFPQNHFLMNEVKVYPNVCSVIDDLLQLKKILYKDDIDIETYVNNIEIHEINCDENELTGRKLSYYTNYKEFKHCLLQQLIVQKIKSKNQMPINSNIGEFVNKLSKKKSLYNLDHIYVINNSDINRKMLNKIKTKDKVKSKISSGIRNNFYLLYLDEDNEEDNVVKLTLGLDNITFYKIYFDDVLMKINSI